MKAAVLTKSGSLEIREVEVPRVGPDDVLVRVKACGICHTDVAILKGSYSTRKKPPVILGHEISGEIAETGRGVKGVKPGERVAVYQCITCGRCEACRSGRENLCIHLSTLGMDQDGGYAEYVSVPAENVFRLPPEISCPEGAILTDAFSTAFRGVERARIEVGERIAIFGVGALGLSAIQVAARLRGAEVIAVDVIPEKLALASEMGAAHVVNARDADPVEAINDITHGRGADGVLEFVGTPKTYEQALKSVRRGGKVMLVGASREVFSVNPYRLFKEEVTVSGSYASVRSNIATLIELARTGRIDPKRLVTRTVPLVELREVMGNIATGVERCIRVVVEP